MCADGCTDLKCHYGQLLHWITSSLTPEVNGITDGVVYQPRVWPTVIFPICGRMALMSVNTWVEGNDGLRVGVFLGCVMAGFLNCFSYKTETDTLTFSCFQLAKAHLKKKYCWQIAW